MGRDKSKARTKGNLKPASSSQASDLLTTENLAFGKNALANNQVLGLSSNAFLAAQDAFTGVGSELLPILRKLIKRDLVTKQRGLQELELILRRDVSKTESLFTVWPVLFRQLCLEQDARIRLVTMRVHELVVGHMGKELGPLIRDIIGYWMLCCVDSSRGVTSAAYSAFNAAFPPQKHLKVFQYCGRALIEFYAANLVKATPQTFSDTRFVSQDDAMSKYMTVVGSSLRGLRLLLDTIATAGASEEDSMETVFSFKGGDEVRDTLQELLDSHAFVEWLDSKSMVVKMAMYETVRILLKKYEGMVSKRFLTRAEKYSLGHVELTHFPAYWDTLALYDLYDPSLFADQDNVDQLLTLIDKSLSKAEDVTLGEKVSCFWKASSLAKSPDFVEGYFGAASQAFVTCVRVGGDVQVWLHTFISALTGFWRDDTRQFLTRQIRYMVELYLESGPFRVRKMDKWVDVFLNDLKGEQRAALQSVLYELLDTYIKSPLEQRPENQQRLARLCGLMIDPTTSQGRELLEACLEALEEPTSDPTVAAARFVSLTAWLDVLSTGAEFGISLGRGMKLNDLVLSWVDSRDQSVEVEHTSKAFSRILCRICRHTNGASIWKMCCSGLSSKMSNTRYRQVATVTLQALFEEALSQRLSQPLHDPLFDEMFASSWHQAVSAPDEFGLAHLVELMVCLASPPTAMLSLEALEEFFSAMSHGLSSGSEASVACLRPLAEWPTRAIETIGRMSCEVASDFVIELTRHSDSDMNGLSKRLTSEACGEPLLRKTLRRCCCRLYDVGDELGPMELFACVSRLSCSKVDRSGMIPVERQLSDLRKASVSHLLCRSPVWDPVGWLYLPEVPVVDGEDAEENFFCYERVIVFYKEMLQSPLMDFTSLGYLQAEILMFEQIRHDRKRRPTVPIRDKPVSNITTGAMELIYDEDRPFWKCLLMFDNDMERFRNDWERELFKVQRMSPKTATERMRLWLSESSGSTHDFPTLAAIRVAIQRIDIYETRQGEISRLVQTMNRLCDSVAAVGLIFDIVSQLLKLGQVTELDTEVKSSLAEKVSTWLVLTVKATDSESRISFHFVSKLINVLFDSQLLEGGGMLAEYVECIRLVMWNAFLEDLPDMPVEAAGFCVSFVGRHLDIISDIGTLAQCIDLLSLDSHEIRISAFRILKESISEMPRGGDEDSGALKQLFAHTTQAVRRYLGQSHDAAFLTALMIEIELLEASRDDDSPLQLKLDVMDLAMTGLLRLKTPFVSQSWLEQAISMEFASVYEMKREQLGELAAWIILKLLLGAPSSVRTWFASTSKRALHRDLEQFARKVLCPIILRHHRNQILSYGWGMMGNFSVKVADISTHTEVLASYDIDDSGIQVRINLHPTFPLKKAAVEGVKKAGVSDDRYRSWLLNITSQLSYGNASFVTALKGFHKNVALHLEGVEDCLICYYIIGVHDGTLPSLQCKTCHMKYHAGCLYRWFRQSGKSNCPHCQMPF